MEQERYQQQYKAFVQQAEQRLNELCDVYLPVKAQISQAARYSLLGGGKRVRAVLVLAACQLAGGDFYHCQCTDDDDAFTAEILQKSHIVDDAGHSRHRFRYGGLLLS